MVNKVIDPKTVKPLKIRNKTLNKGTFGFEVLFELDNTEFEVRLLHMDNNRYLKIRFAQKFIVIENKIYDIRSKIYDNTIEFL